MCSDNKLKSERKIQNIEWNVAETQIYKLKIIKKNKIDSYNVVASNNVVH